MALPWDHPTPRRVEDDEQAGQPHVLIVDADANAASLLASFMEHNGLWAATAHDDRDLDLALASARFDVAIACTKSPAEDGLSLCRRFWAEAVSVILLTAECETVDRIVGLELGADACLPKSCSPREVLAHARAIIRSRARSTPAAPGRNYRFGKFLLDSAGNLLVHPSGEAVVLTQGERRLLVALLERPNQAHQRASLTGSGRTDAASIRSVDVKIARLRRKLGEEGSDGVIRTIRGLGYKLVAHVSRTHDGAGAALVRA